MPCRPLCSGLFTACLLCAVMGCNAFRPAAPAPAPPGSVPKRVESHNQNPHGMPPQAAGQGPHVTLSVKPKRGNMKTQKIALSEGMAVQQALEAGDVLRKYRNIEIKVARVTPLSDGMRVPLNVEFDVAKRRVSVLHDITLHPGDHILVKEDDRSAWQKAIGGIAPLRPENQPNPRHAMR